MEWISIGTTSEDGVSRWYSYFENCSHVFIPADTSVRCTFCDWEPSNEELACFLNTKMWFDEWKSRNA